jgi:hypothetical protein
MNYTVDWVPRAEQELAALWMDAQSRDAVTRASHRIDQLLRHDPEQAGESRPRGRRILFELPLGVVFRVYPDRRLVRVLHVWRID